MTAARKNTASLDGPGAVPLDLQIAAENAAESGENPTASPRRVVLLGASNVARGMSTIYAASHLLWGSPLDFCGAFGHGRSYGAASSFMGRSLCGIVDSGLWTALESKPPAPTAALVTDIGNDLLYGVDADVIAAWVETCVSRLAEQEARTIITELPLDGVERIPEWKYLLMRRFLFPRSRLSLAETIDRARALNDHLQAIAERHGATMAAQRAEWYGFDSIHIKLNRWIDAWSEILAPWSSDETKSKPRGSLLRWLRLRLLLPEERIFWRVTQRRAQPAIVMRDGTAVSLY